jgi:hypothetical protein
MGGHPEGDFTMEMRRAVRHGIVTAGIMAVVGLGTVLPASALSSTPTLNGGSGSGSTGGGGLPPAPPAPLPVNPAPCTASDADGTPITDFGSGSSGFVINTYGDNYQVDCPTAGGGSFHFVPVDGPTATPTSSHG